MGFLEMIGCLAILVVAFILVCLVASVFCNPIQANTAPARMANRASRELEQNLYTICGGISLAIVVVVCLWLLS